MEKKQSSIEWLTEKISYQTSNGEIITYHKNIADLIQQAKAMHKDEIIRPLISMGWSEEIAESHYNVIYGGNNEKIS